MPWKQEDWDKFSQGYQQHAGNAPTPAGGGDSGVLSSIGAGLRGAGRELATQGGFAKDFAQGSDPAHPTAEWVGREAVNWAPTVALDAFGPEVPMAGAALRYAPRLATLAQKGLTGAYKGATGGAAAQPNDQNRGATTGAAVGAGGAAARTGFNMLPWWAKAGMIGALPNAAGLMNTAREATGTRSGYISPWSLHHALSALGGLAAAVAGMPATGGAAASKLQDAMDPEENQ